MAADLWLYPGDLGGAAPLVQVVLRIAVRHGGEEFSDH